MKLRYRILFALFVIIVVGLLTYINIHDHAAAADIVPDTSSTSSLSPGSEDSGVIETSVPLIAGIPPSSVPSPEPSAEPRPITAADWYGVAPADLQGRLQGLYIPTVAEVDKTAKMMPGEFNGSSITERAQPVWCVCNRIDAGGDFKNTKTVARAINRDQFWGYNPNKPVIPEYRDLAIDVYTRWLNEKLGFSDMGRVLPPEFVFFSADKHHQHNIYRTTWRSSNPECKFYDGSLLSPYES